MRFGLQLSRAADPIGESVRLSRQGLEKGSVVSHRVQNSFKTGAELLASVTEDNVSVANPIDVASLVSVAKDANAEQAAHLITLINDRVRRPNVAFMAAFS